MLQGEYARTALQTGLQLEQKLGVNPYKFGLIGSTDSHTSLATADDNNFFGKNTPSEPGRHRVEHHFMKTKVATDRGLGADRRPATPRVWATENTRAALWDAMKRKETYATTGPRMTVRFFGGWDYSDADVKGDLVKAGYDKGVPMGGDLKTAAAGKSPTFLASAMKDPEGGNLDRIQIVKGWVDAQRRAAGEGLRRGLVGRSQARRRRQAARGRQHGRSQHGDLHQQHRRGGAVGRVDGP